MDNMALKYPWFKFAPTDWVMGKIQKCPEVTQARFVRLCCLYWNKECVLSIDDAKIEIDEDHLNTLIDKKIVKVDAVFIQIEFLDDQQSECGENSETKRRAAQARWSKNNAGAMQVHTGAMHNYADRKIDKTKPEKKDQNNFFELFWSKYPTKVSKQKTKSLFLKLTDAEIQTILNTIDSFVKYKPFPEYTHPHPTTYLNQKRWQDEIPTTLPDKTKPQITRDVWFIARQIPAQKQKLCDQYQLTDQEFDNLYK